MFKQKEFNTGDWWHIMQEMGFPKGLGGKESACSARDPDLIPGSGRSPGGGHGNPLQYSWLEIPWTEELGGLQSMGSHRIWHNWATNTTNNGRAKHQTEQWGQPEMNNGRTHYCLQAGAGFSIRDCWCFGPDDPLLSGAMPCVYTMFSLYLWRSATRSQ